RGATRCRFLAGALAQLVSALRELDERLDRGRVRCREARQARRDWLQRLAVADARERRRPHGAELRRRVLRPRPLAQRLELREPLIADEVDVRALAAVADDAVAAAQRLGEVAVDDVRARQLADREATGPR